MACATYLERLYQIRENLLNQIEENTLRIIGNNYSYSIEGQSLTVGVDTIPNNISVLMSQLDKINDLIAKYDIFEIHTVLE